MRGWPADDRDRLQQLLQAVDGNLARLARACTQVRRTLAGLRKQLDDRETGRR